VKVEDKEREQRHPESFLSKSSQQRGDDDPAEQTVKQEMMIALVERSLLVAHGTSAEID
jgi:hypothetical protein